MQPRDHARIRIRWNEHLNRPLHRASQRGRSQSSVTARGDRESGAIDRAGAPRGTARLLGHEQHQQCAEEVARLVATRHLMSLVFDPNSAGGTESKSF